MTVCSRVPYGRGWSPGAHSGAAFVSPAGIAGSAGVSNFGMKIDRQRESIVGVSVNEFVLYQQRYKGTSYDNMSKHRSINSFSSVTPVSTSSLSNFFPNFTFGHSSSNNAFDSP